MQVEAVHLPGKENGLADALSCNNIPHFLQAFPGVAKSPSHLPRQALALLVEEQLDITTLDRTVCRPAFIGMDWHNPHSGLMCRGETLPPLL